MSVSSFDAPTSVALIETLPQRHGDSQQFNSILTFEQTLFMRLSLLLNWMWLDDLFLLVPNYLRFLTIFESASKYSF